MGLRSREVEETDQGKGGYGVENQAGQKLEAE